MKYEPTDEDIKEATNLTGLSASISLAKFVAKDPETGKPTSAPPPLKTVQAYFSYTLSDYGVIYP